MRPYKTAIALHYTIEGHIIEYNFVITCRWNFIKPDQALFPSAELALFHSFGIFHRPFRSLVRSLALYAISSALCFRVLLATSVSQRAEYIKYRMLCNGSVILIPYIAIMRTAMMFLAKQNSDFFSSQYTSRAKTFKLSSVICT